MKRYVRNIAVEEIDIEGQETLNSSTALVIGAGGLGSHTLYSLSSMGFGNIIVVDHDFIALSNLQRQILFNESAVGKNKAVEACKTLNKYNSNVNHFPVPFLFTSIESVMSDMPLQIDIIFDCSDNYETKALISKEAAKNGNIPVVFASAADFSGFVFTEFHHENNGFLDIFDAHEDDKLCNEQGILNMSCAFVSSIQAMEGVKIITGLSEKENTYFEINTFNYTVRPMVMANQEN